MQGGRWWLAKGIPSLLWLDAAAPGAQGCLQQRRRSAIPRLPLALRPGQRCDEEAVNQQVVQIPALRTLASIYRAARSRFEAKRQGLVGLEFAEFGRQLARRIALRSRRRAVELWVTPVNCVRYFEFDFSWRHLPAQADLLVDVSSPRLFPLRVAVERRARRVLATNPDALDLAETRWLIDAAGVSGIDTAKVYVDGLAISDGTVDVVSCISVVEHIPERGGDFKAVQKMYNLLRPGGTLLLTVPVCPVARVDYRDRPAYAIENHTNEEGTAWFFERRYDWHTIQNSLLSACEGADVSIEFYGEQTEGVLDAYFERWREAGWRATADDAAFMAREFRAYSKHADMPGSGVCCMAIRKNTP